MIERNGNNGGCDGDPAAAYKGANNSSSGCGPNSHQTLQHLSEILPELTVLAERAGLDVTPHLLRVALKEVEEHLDGEETERID